MNTITEERRGETKRIQFEFSAEALQRLNKMRDQTDAASYAELVRDALRVYEWVIDQQRAGNDIGVVKDDILVKTVRFIL